VFSIPFFLYYFVNLSCIRQQGQIYLTSSTIFLQIQTCILNSHRYFCRPIERGLVKDGSLKRTGALVTEGS
jgi:hypothetical protein